MEILKATLWIYRTALLRSGQLATGNWKVAFAPLGYSLILSVAGVIFIRLGILGGMLFVLTVDACMSSGLYLIEIILKKRKVNFNDFLWGFSAYLWEIVRISFILWIPMMVVESVLASIPNGHLFLLFIQITLYIILNAVPELIYQSRTSGLDLLAASYNFIIENWPEWFTPNLIITLAGIILFKLLILITGILPWPLQFFVVTFALGLFAAYLMILRTLLFSELDDSNRRSRVYRYKMRG